MSALNKLSLSTIDEKLGDSAQYFENELQALVSKYVKGGQLCSPEPKNYTKPKPQTVERLRDALDAVSEEKVFAEFIPEALIILLKGCCEAQLSIKFIPGTKYETLARSRMLADLATLYMKYTGEWISYSNGSIFCRLAAKVFRYCNVQITPEGIASAIQRNVALVLKSPPGIRIKTEEDSEPFINSASAMPSGAPSSITLLDSGEELPSPIFGEVGTIDYNQIKTLGGIPRLKKAGYEVLEASPVYECPTSHFDKNNSAIPNVLEILFSRCLCDPKTLFSTPVQEGLRKFFSTAHLLIKEENAR